MLPRNSLLQQRWRVFIIILELLNQDMWPLLLLLVLFVYGLQDNVAVLNDAASSAADKAEALGNLQVLVEPIDNANGEQAAAAAV
jgi:hypothetical protein